MLNSLWRRPRHAGGLLLALIGLLVTAQVASAQSDRKQLIEELLESLRESELQKLDNNRPTLNSASPQANVRVTNSRQIHDTLETFTRDCSDLALTLSESVNQIPGVRDQLTEVYRLRARSSLLADRTKTGDQWSSLLDDVKTIDRDWRAVSYKLAQLHGLNNNQRRLVQRLDQSSERLMGFMEARPQLNYYELTKTIASLDVDFRNLMEEVQFELGNTSEGQRLLSDTRKTQQQVQHIGVLVRDQKDYEIIVQEFGRFTQMWDPIMLSLQRHNNRYIERSLRRISDSSTAFHELLWLPHEVDRQQLLYLTSLLKKDVDEFFSRTPLKLLINLPNSQYILPTADAFYGVCENFTDLAQRGESEQQLVEAFSYIEESQQEFSRMFKPIKSQSALNVLTAIDQHVHDLRSAMVIQENFDRRKAIELGASLENLSDHLSMDVKLWMNRVQAGYRADALRESADFARRSAEFHKLAREGANVDQLRRSANELYENWRRVHGYISLSQNEDRVHLAQLATSIGPALVEIRTIVQQ